MLFFTFMRGGKQCFLRWLADLLIPFAGTNGQDLCLNVLGGEGKTNFNKCRN